MVMKKLAIALALGVYGAAMAASIAADAAPKRVRVCNSDPGYWHCTWKRYDPSDESTRIRARNLDPAGNYAGYPAWAQYALSPKSDGGNMRR
jgi:predicted RNA-binding Zn ribbon-like protein